MPKKLHRKSKEVIKTAKERISHLFKEAEKAYSEDSSLSNRYVELARKIAMKYNIRIPKDLKRRFCKHCYTFLMPGKNLRVRNQEGKIVYCCLECKKYMRYPVRKK
jgi:ribonuclease P protein subunit RPR2